MKVLHKAKQMLHGFVLPKDRFDPAWFFPSDSGWKTLELLVDRAVALVTPGTISLWLAKLKKSKGKRVASSERNALIKGDFERLEPRQSLRNSVFFGLPAFVLIGSFIIGGFSDSAEATSSCTNQLNQNGVTEVHVVGADCVLTFSNVGISNWPRPTGVTVAKDVVIIAGGGGGGTRHGGGGGAGGFQRLSNISLSSTSFQIVVGNRGFGAGPSSGATSGGNSSAFGFTSNGGGRGAGNGWGHETGGSGGGANSNFNGALGTAGQGNNGGTGFTDSGYGGTVALGGGGGKGAVGQNGSSYDGGNGGAGQANSITGSSVTYAGGGGGAGYNSGGLGGSGGGGNAGRDGNSAALTSGAANSGGGGGAPLQQTSSGAGGSGIVVIKWRFQ
jgi:hypothetical protein